MCSESSKCISKCSHILRENEGILQALELLKSMTMLSWKHKCFLRSQMHHHFSLWKTVQSPVIGLPSIFTILYFFHHYHTMTHLSFHDLPDLFNNLQWMEGTNSVQPLGEQTSVRLHWETALVSCRSLKSIYKASIFTMIYWKQQLVLIKPSQNIKLIEPTAV